MSADNWGLCPVCIEEQEKKKEVMFQKVQDSYGKIPADEYLAKLKEYEEFANRKLTADDRTFREDYTIGVDEEGFFELSYHGRCQTCNFEVDLSHSADLLRYFHNGKDHITFKDIIYEPD